MTGKMTSFEEQFPSLKGKGREVENLAKLWGIEFRYKETGEIVKTKIDVFDSITISKNCIDKQKVINIINIQQIIVKEKETELQAFKRYLKKELGL